MDFKEFQRHIDLFLDGELDTSSALKFQELVDTDPRCRNLVERKERLRIRVREELSKERVPEMLRAKVLRGLRKEDWRHRTSQFTGWRAAAAILLTVFIGGAIYFQNDTRDLSRLVDNSVTIHQVYGATEEPTEFRAANERTLLPWIQKRVRFPMALPSLAQNDIELVGVRISLLVDRQSVLTFYRKSNQRLSLFTIEEQGIRLPHWGGTLINGRMVYFQESNNYQVAVWRDAVCVYTLVAQMEQGDLVKYLSIGFEEIVRSQVF